ncbi:DUF934 domain-containing protein [Thalassobius vesicularis]|uniref:DUF934 domain-containing protein n=1 Tax=Thalassobius vesicularis TaxID=1294297 RepID=A0A4S3M7W9_9RHOB|nr:DUF934 domain-containing protein [Thalassobius vesicularis]THD73442.1 DUF934 domain-containing protein [Thalassobius vesicularis]
MSVIVTDAGFGPDDWTGGFTALGEAANDVLSLDVPSDAEPEALTEQLAHLQMVRIAFPAFSDGRGFTLAKRLRLMGYTGRLRAHGHVIADQYTMARRSGFDEVEINDDLAARQPADQWQFRSDWQENDYQSRLRRG